MAGDPRNAILDSRYPADKIIYLPPSGSISVPNGSVATTTIVHGLGFTPLMKGNWSLSPTFATSYELSSNLGGDTSRCDLTISSDGTNVTLLPYNNTGSTQIIYYRMYGLMPSNVNLDAPITVGLADNAMFNSQYNYTKLFLADIANASSATQTVTHNLGYIPQMEVWLEQNSGKITYWNTTSADPADNFTWRSGITTTTAVFYKGSNVGVPDPYKQYHFRIYIDD